MKATSNGRQILNLSSGDQAQGKNSQKELTQSKNSQNKLDFKWKTTSKYQKLNISATTN